MKRSVEEATLLFDYPFNTMEWNMNMCHVIFEELFALVWFENDCKYDKNVRGKMREQGVNQTNFAYSSANLQNCRFLLLSHFISPLHHGELSFGDLLSIMPRSLWDRSLRLNNITGRKAFSQLVRPFACFFGGQKCNHGVTWPGWAITITIFAFLKS